MQAVWPLQKEIDRLCIEIHRSEAHVANVSHNTYATKLFLESTIYLIRTAPTLEKYSEQLETALQGYV